MEIEKSKSASYAIVIVSSDEDDDEDVEKLFEAFVSKAEMFVAKKECIILLRVKFAEARVEFVSSAKFKNSLKWRTDKVDESNAYILTKEIFNLLASDVKGGQSKSKSSVTEDERDNRDCFAGNEEVTKHSTGEETGQTQSIISVTNKGNDDLKGFKLESHQPSTSSASYSTNGFTENKKTQKRKRQEIVSINLDDSKIVLKLTSAKKRRIVRKLEEKLKHISERIKILNKSELSLDEMNMNDSTYIQECRLKDRFNKIWKKICRINGRAPDTGRVTEKEIKCPHTGFREIDRAVNRFLKKKRGRFPDRFDINNVILETKKKHGLKIAPQVIKEITDEVFMYVGNKLQKRRRLDFTNNSGSFLTDCHSAGEDPAMTDSVLLKKLEENKKDGSTHDDKQAVTGDRESASLDGAPQCLSMAEQNSASRKNSDLNKENGDIVTTELSPDSTSTAVSDLLTDTVCSSSNVQHLVRDDEVHTKEYLEKTAKRQMEDSTPSGSEKYSHNPNSMKEYGEDCKSSVTSPQIKKRKAEIGLSEYQSPLKAFCKGISRHCEEEKESYKTFAKSSTADNAPPSTNSLPTTPNNVSPNHAKREKKFSLSLNKNGRHSPRTKSVSENKFDVIVLSDDDDEGNG
ncbi:Death domain-associated protein 6 [Acropora cervicornis]|uniref:Death domain-associated protein 6 n=1 Tax=Acropora cervicornis TaxID=6130 RepID=A0AAD9QQS2_ACRCE|nr:Death domain-associated protein 6 [Acropora cervicornis]